MRPDVIAVTGASGFTGPFVVQALRRRFPSATIRCVVRPSSRRDRLEPFGVEYAVGDLRNVPSLCAAFRGADTLVNVSSLGFDWVEPLFDAIHRSSFRRGVFIGTTAMLTRLPARTKPMRERGEALVQSSKFPWTIVRPTMIYGTPEDRNIARLIRFVLASPIIPVIAPNAQQQPIHVEDVAAAVTAAVDAESSYGRAYNIAGRDPLTLRAVIDTVIHAAGVRRLTIQLPTSPVRWLVAGARHLGVRRLTTEQIDRIHEDKSFAYDDAARDLGFAPRSFADGVAAELAMIRSQRVTRA